MPEAVGRSGPCGRFYGRRRLLSSTSAAPALLVVLLAASKPDAGLAACVSGDASANVITCTGIDSPNLDVGGGDGDDIITIEQHSHLDDITGDKDDDTIVIDNAKVNSVHGNAGDDGIDVRNGATVTGDVDGGAGLDEIVIRGDGTIVKGSITAGNDADTITVSNGAVVEGGINAGGDVADDVIEIDGATVTGLIGADKGADTLRIHGGSVTSAGADLGDGADTARLIANGLGFDTGLIDGGAGGSDSFELIGDGSGTFDVSDFDNFELGVKNGASTWTLTGTNADAMDWSVKDGALYVNGDMASGGSGSAFTVSPGANQSGLLGGDGTILSARVEDGGIIDPGSAAGAVGTLTLSASTNNALRFDSGSAYVVELSNGTSDLITGTGKARIDGGLVEVGGVSGPIADGERFTILDMSDLAGIGTFDNADDRALDDLAFYDFSIVYEATSQGTVELVAESAFDSEASTPNERAVAGSLAGIGGSPAYDDVLAYLASVPSGDGGSALNSLSGEVYATNQVVSSWTGMAFSRALRDRGLALASGGPKVEASAYVGTDSAPAGAQAIHLLAADAPEEPVAFPRDVYSDPDRLGVWAGGFGGWQRIDSDGNAGDAENWVGGFIGGAERQWQTRGGIGEIGVALGYSHGRTDVADRESGADNDAFHAGAYAGAAIGRLTLSGAFGFAHISSDVSRDLPGGLGTSTANVDSDVLSASAEAAYTMPLGAFGIGPVTAFDAAWVRQDRFAEDGGGAIALTGDSEDYAVYIPGIGARLSLLHANGARMSMLDARALWRHRLGNGAPDQTMAFSGAPASEPFAVEGLQGAEDWVELGLGASIRIDDVTMRGRYDAELGDGSTTHSGSVSLTVSF